MPSARFGRGRFPWGRSAPATNRVASRTVEGVSLDRPRAEPPADAFHHLRQMFAVPETSPAATMDLPPVARALARKAIRVEGALAELLNVGAK